MAQASTLRAVAPGDIALVSFNRVPEVNPSCKYERLGPMALANQRRYAERHGYGFFGSVLPAADAADIPACWHKLPAILQALQSHSWVLWADSDALVLNPALGLEDLCDPLFDLVVQRPRAYFERIGQDPDAGLAAMPINSGVFMVQATSWSRQLLEDAFALRPAASLDRFWNGIGEQEALIKMLKRKPADFARIRYVDGLQSHPALHQPGNRFVHFYGNQASHLISAGECEEVLQRWERALAGCEALPIDLARFHWCCIQNKVADAAIDRGGPERFLYRPEDISLAGYPARA